jgi:two-component system, cell cycle response regulator DivK
MPSTSAVHTERAPPAGLGPAPRRTRVPHIASSAPEGRDVPQASPTVLIAEDNPDSREALSTLLTSLDYQVIQAADGAEAVELAREHEPDVILMDMMMPVMDGFEAVRLLRTEPRFRDLPIVAVTAMEGVRERVLSAGCTAIYRKPLNVREFLAALHGWARR